LLNGWKSSIDYADLKPGEIFGEAAKMFQPRLPPRRPFTIYITPPQLQNVGFAGDLNALTEACMNY
jgi:hypothetical protein